MDIMSINVALVLVLVFLLVIYLVLLFSLGSQMPMVSHKMGWGHYNDTKLPVFKEKGLEDLEKHWFLYEVVWNVRHV